MEIGVKKLRCRDVYEEQDLNVIFYRRIGKSIAQRLEVIGLREKLPVFMTCLLMERHSKSYKNDTKGFHLRIQPAIHTRIEDPRCKPRLNDRRDFVIKHKIECLRTIFWADSNFLVNETVSIIIPSSSCILSLNVSNTQASTHQFESFERCFEK